jgi:hypothetical protein
MTRTTITLEDDVAAKVRAEMRRTGRSFKQTVNDLLRRGAEQTGTVKRRKFAVRARDLGLMAGYELDNIGALLEQLEGPAHR